jgi:uncharacterized protein YndB with AHSA1/START domain
MPSDVEVVSTRAYAAPRELVFRAFTDPELITQWWGPAKYTTTIDNMDVRPGGAWRYVSRGDDGVEHAFSGVYREIDPPGRLVYTFNYEPLPGNHELVETITLEEADGITTVTDHMRFRSKEDRDGMVDSGMESGATESMDRLEDLLGVLQP